MSNRQQTDQTQQPKATNGSSTQRGNLATGGVSKLVPK